jgi:hypothetical protein
MAGGAERFSFGYLNVVSRADDVAWAGVPEVRADDVARAGVPEVRADDVARAG